MRTVAVAIVGVLAGACGTETEGLEVPDAGPGASLDAGSAPPGDAGAPDTGLSEPADAGFDDGRFYDPDHLLDVHLEMLPEDFEALRLQDRTLSSLFEDNACLEHSFSSPFTYFPARLTIDGQVLDDVGVRKKGFFGSLNTRFPSLKVKTDVFVEGQLFEGLERFTFNNARQGGQRSLVRQCLGYQLFAAAGLPAPRCNWARVRVNAEDLGIFVHVESLKKRFLRRHYDDDEGALYEGQLSDFTDGFIGTFERKTNEELEDRSDLEAVRQALLVPDEQLLDALGPLVNIDQFLGFWAMETLIGHWDGYSGSNNNNFYIYRDPTSGAFEFIPWGIDSTFGYGPPPEPFVSVAAHAAVPRRLFALPEVRARYFETLEGLLTSVWREPALRADINRFEATILAALPMAHRPGFRQALSQLRAFVDDRRGALEAELRQPPESWPLPPKEGFCYEQTGEISGSFDTTWGTHPAENIFLTGGGTLTGTVGENGFTGVTVGSSAGIDPGSGRAGLLIATYLNPPLIVAFLQMPEAVVRGGAVLEIGEAGASGDVYYIPYAGAQAQPVGNLIGGQLRFEVASTAEGAPVRGVFESPIFGFQPR